MPKYCGRAVTRCCVIKAGCKGLWWLTKHATVLAVPAAIIGSGEWALRQVSGAQTQEAGGIAARFMGGTAVDLTHSRRVLPDGNYTWTPGQDFKKNASWDASGLASSVAVGEEVEAVLTTKSFGSPGTNITAKGDNKVLCPSTASIEADRFAINWGVYEVDAYYQGYEVEVLVTGTITSPSGAVTELPRFNLRKDTKFYRVELNETGPHTLTATGAIPYNTSYNISADCVTNVVGLPSSVQGSLNISAVPADHYAMVSAQIPDAFVYAGTEVDNVSYAIQYLGADGDLQWATGNTFWVSEQDNGPRFYVPIDTMANFNVSIIKPIYSINGKQVPVEVTGADVGAAVGLSQCASYFTIDVTWRVPIAVGALGAGAAVVNEGVYQLGQRLRGQEAVPCRSLNALNVAMFVAAAGWIVQMACDAADNPDILNNPGFPLDLIGLSYRVSSSSASVPGTLGENYRPGFSGYVALQDLPGVIVALLALYGQLRSAKVGAKWHRMFCAALTLTAVAVRAASAYSRDPSAAGFAGATVNVVMAFVAQIFVVLHGRKYAALAQNASGFTEPGTCLRRFLCGVSGQRRASVQEDDSPYRELGSDEESGHSSDGPSDSDMQVAVKVDPENAGAMLDAQGVAPVAVRVGRAGAFQV